MPFETETKALYIIMDLFLVMRITEGIYNILTKDLNVLML